MLEKAILVDQLNKKILHRPGPLELIEKNILHANEPIERIVKEGLVPFKVSNEDNLTEQNFLSFEDDSQSSEGDLFQQSQIKAEVIATEIEKPKEIEVKSQDKHIFESLPTSSGVINISLVPTNNLISSTPISVATFKIHQNVETINIPPPPPPPKLELITYHVKPVLQTQVKASLMNTQSFLPIQIGESPMTNVNAILSTNLVQAQTQNTVNQHVSSFIQNNQKFSAPGKEKNRKKCKNKAASKARAIKFHEYKGPPSKGSGSSSSSLLSSSAATAACKKVGETNYELIMQQQCLLEYLEGIYKNPHHTPKPESESHKFMNKPMKIERLEMNEEREKSVEKSKTFNKPHVTIFPSKPSTQLSPSNNIEMSKDTTITDVAKLSKMKVSELKAYLKRVNLPVSGPKPLLIERLKPYLPLKPLDDSNDDSVNMVTESNDFYNTSLHSVSSAESDMDNMDSSCISKPSSVASSTKEDDIVAEQQRKIEELQRKLMQSQHELEQMKQIKTVDVPAPPNHQNFVIEPQYQMHSPISTVFVVDVSSGNSDDPKVSLSPASVQSQVLLDPSTSSSMHEEPSLVQNISNTDDMLGQNEEPVLNLTQQQINKQINPSTSSSIPMSDITDVLEILLKNGEWPDMVEDGKGLNANFIQNQIENSSLTSENILTTKRYIEDVLSSQVPFGIMSPMNEDPILQADQTIEKILGKFLVFYFAFNLHIVALTENVTPSNGNSSMLNGSYSNGYTSNVEFPMDIEDDSLVNSDYNRNLFQNSEFLDKPHDDIMQSYGQNQFNRMKAENCDNQYLKSDKSVQESRCADGLMIKSEFPDELQKSQSNCTKNGLIGNFDHNLFDTLKNNNNNNNNNPCNDLFLSPQEGKFAKDDNKSLITNLHLSNNYDLFSTSIDNTAMDFESIIPYNDLHSHDSIFQISGFDGSMGRNGGFGSFSDHNNLLFDDTRMSNGDNMTCEVDNLLCNL